jgi:hypothetical protein
MQLMQVEVERYTRWYKCTTAKTKHGHVLNGGNGRDAAFWKLYWYIQNRHSSAVRWWQGQVEHISFSRYKPWSISNDASGGREIMRYRWRYKCTTAMATFWMVATMASGLQRLGGLALVYLRTNTRNLVTTCSDQCQKTMTWNGLMEEWSVVL